MLKQKLLFFCLLGTIQTTYAAFVTVKKIKGRQAIIETTSALEVGQTYELQKDIISFDPNGSKPNNRGNSLQFGAELRALTASQIQDNQISVTARYGWNFEYFEIGPTVSYLGTDVGAGTNSDFFGGGFLDYNVKKNRSQTEYVWGPTVSAEVGLKQFSTGSSANLMSIDFGGFLTWYLLGTSTALRIQGGYHYQKISTSTADVALAGFASKSYLVFYF
jgi:hypothetical protein